MAELEKLDSLLESKSSAYSRGWRRFTFAAIGVYLAASAIYEFAKSGASQRVFLNVFLCLCAFLVLKFEKRIYVSPLGFVKETKTWFSHHREILAWDEIGHVTLVTKGLSLTAFLEKDITGWKVLFTRNDLAALDGIFRKYAPKLKVAIKEMGPR